MTSKDQAWVAAKLAKLVDMNRLLTELLDTLALHAHAELCRWCGSKLRQRLHEEVIAGNMGTAQGIANATAVVLSRMKNGGK